MSYLSPHELGLLGERLAGEHLASLGYRILEHNWRWQRGEIDVIATQNDEIVFVEVKARRTQTYGSPEESITPSKQRKLIQAANAYLGSTNQSDVDWRIDVIVIDMDSSGKVERLEQIVSAVEGG